MATDKKLYMNNKDVRTAVSYRQKHANFKKTLVSVRKENFEKSDNDR